MEEPKVIRENLRWRHDGGRLKIEATVFALNSETLLSLRAVAGRSHSYSLLCNNVTVRRLCASDWARHTNPEDGQTIQGPHKHRLTDEYQDRVVYVPDDMTYGDSNDELMAFLAECNVTLEGTYQRVM